MFRNLVRFLAGSTARPWLWVIGSAALVPFTAKVAVPGVKAAHEWLVTDAPAKRSYAGSAKRQDDIPSPPEPPRPAPKSFPSEEREPGRYLVGRIKSVSSAGASAVVANNGSRPAVVHLCAFSDRGKLMGSTSSIVQPGGVITLLLDSGGDTERYTLATGATEHERMAYAVPEMPLTLAYASPR